jgi:hypothetical protein
VCVTIAFMGTGWFEELYAAGTAGAATMPWSRTAPHPLLSEWTAVRDGTGRTAVVVGCGLGADAEHVAGVGYDTTAFDIAETAVAVARARNRGSAFTTPRPICSPCPATGATPSTSSWRSSPCRPCPSRRAGSPSTASPARRSRRLAVRQRRAPRPRRSPGRRCRGTAVAPDPRRDPAFADGLEVVRVDAEGEPGHPLWRAGSPGPSEYLLESLVRNQATVPAPRPVSWPGWRTAHGAVLVVAVSAAARHRLRRCGAAEQSHHREVPGGVHSGHRGAGRRP